MSGFEVAGLVLGSFPLIISALEHYRKAGEAWGTFWKFRREYDHWIHQLKVCRLAFEQNLEEFLLPLVVEDDELTALLAEPGGSRWKNPELEERLRERLPKSYELYLESMARIEKVMAEVRKRLYLENADFQDRLVDVADDSQDNLLARVLQLSIDESKAVIKVQTQRIKLSLGQAKRDQLFQDLTDCNNELRSLLDTSDRIAALRQAREANKKDKAVTAAGKALWQFWRHADRLYALITRAFRCECREFHLANLLLQHRTTPKVDFRVLFFFASPRGNGNAGGGGGGGWSWTCQETRIDLLENTKPRPSRAPAVRFMSAPAAITSSCSMPTAVVSATAAPLTPTASDVSRTSRTPSPTFSFPSPIASSVPSKSSFRKSLMEMFKKGHIKKGSQTIIILDRISSPISPSPVHSPLPVVVPITHDIEASTTLISTATPQATPESPIIPVIVAPTLTPASSEIQEDDSTTIDIINLCETMAKLPKGKHAVPPCLTDDEAETSFAINPVSNPTALRDTISLESLLMGAEPHRKLATAVPRPALTRRQRYFIALTLASSYLQLHSSPWISPRWNKREILFLRDPACPGGVVLDQPYISRNFPEGGNSGNSHGCDPGCAPIAVAARDDRSLGSLGIMLLELCFGTAVEAHELRRGRILGVERRKKEQQQKKKKKRLVEGDDNQDCSADDEGDGNAVLAESEDENEVDRWFLDMVTALQWSQRAAEEAGPDFAEAVEWCLKSKPGSGENDGKLDKWREEMFLKVVTPLKYCHDQLVTVRC